MNSVSAPDSASRPPIEAASPQDIAKLQTKAVGPDALRSLAILLVMLVHLPIEASPALLAGIRAYAWLGVDVFFVLSGFLIGTQLFKEVSRTDHIDLKSFYLRRAFRTKLAFNSW